MTPDFNNVGVVLAARDAGVYNPNTWQAQVQQRNSMWDAAFAANQAQQQQGQQTQLASLQKSFPLPTPGVNPALSPVMQQDMQQQGFTDPNAYVLAQRLGSAKSAVNMPKSLNGQSSIDPEELLNAPSFQPWLKSQPQKAAQVFQALTGKPLFSQDKENPGYMDISLQNKVEQRKFEQSTLQQALAKGEAKMSADGSVLWQQLIPDPINPGKQILSANYGPGNAYQKTLEKHLPDISPALGTFQQQATSPQRQAYLASLQNQPPQSATPTQAPQGMQVSPIWGQGTMGYLNNAVQGMYSDVGQMATGQPPSFVGPAGGANQALGFDAPGGSAVRHAAPVLRNNPQFQQLLRTNPDAARRMIMSIQQGGM